VFRSSVVKKNQQTLSSTFNSPVMGRLLEKIKGRQHLAIVEFGLSADNTQALINQNGNNIIITDIFAFLRKQKRKPNEDHSVFYKRLYRLTSQYLKLPENLVFDVVLCWDGINYLDREVFAFLCRFLETLTHDETLMHAYVYTHEKLPEEPGEFELINNSLVRLSNASAKTVPIKAYNQTDFTQLMPRFSIQQSLLLKNGIQEYLFKCSR